MLGTDKVKCQNALVGGLEAKEDMTVQHLAALILSLTRRPVKVRSDKERNLLIHRNVITLRWILPWVCDEEGHIMGVKAKVVSLIQVLCIPLAGGTGTCLHPCSRSIRL